MKSDRTDWIDEALAHQKRQAAAVALAKKYYEDGYRYIQISMMHDDWCECVQPNPIHDDSGDPVCNCYPDYSVTVDDKDKQDGPLGPMIIVDAETFKDA